MLDCWRSTELQWFGTLGDLHADVFVVCQCKVEPGVEREIVVWQLLVQSVLKPLHREFKSLLASSNCTHACAQGYADPIL